MSKTIFASFMDPDLQEDVETAMTPARQEGLVEASENLPFRRIHSCKKFFLIALIFVRELLSFIFSKVRVLVLSLVTHEGNKEKSSSRCAPSLPCLFQPWDLKIGNPG